MREDGRLSGKICCNVGADRLARTPCPNPRGCGAPVEAARVLTDCAAQLMAVRCGEPATVEPCRTVEPPPPPPPPRPPPPRASSHEGASEGAAEAKTEVGGPGAVRWAGIGRGGSYR